MKRRCEMCQGQGVFFDEGDDMEYCPKCAGEGKYHDDDDGEEEMEEKEDEE